jgi:uncharacterized protein
VNPETSRPLALVTGGSSGIGATFAHKLAARGYDLVLVARHPERLVATAQAIESNRGARVELLEADLASDAGIGKVEQRIATAPNLDFLVNNAGFGTLGYFFSAPIGSQDQMHRLHVLATMRLTHAALQGMVARRRGSIVNVSSVSGFGQNPGSVSYSATKTWMNSFTEGIYMELKAAGSPVRIQALCPGFTITNFHDVAGVDRKTIPAWMWMSAEEVVEASLAGLERDRVFVIPGWRYRTLVFLMRAMPRRITHSLSIKYARATGRANARMD